MQILEQYLRADINKQVSDNFKKIRLWHFALVVGIFALLLGTLTLFGLTDRQNYPQINKDIFISINALWQHAPTLAHNLTQLGDAGVLFAFLLCFALIAPKFWEGLIAGSLLSLVLTHFLKAIYAMPRPARVFGEDAFNIIGEKLMGANSFPSGHTTTIWTALCVLLIAFMPRNFKWRVPFIVGVVLLGAFVGLSRIGVGAHYPLDVLAGALLGCVCGVFGVLVVSRTRIFAWVDSRVGLLIFALFSAICVVMLLKKINANNLFVLYLALIFALYYLFAILRTFFIRISNSTAKNSRESNAIAFILILSVLQVIFFHFPLLSFIRANLALDSFSAGVLFVSLVLFLFALTALMPFLLSLISLKITKIWFALTMLTNALAVYFVATYGTFLDKTMMGNVFNTRYSESGEFLSLKMVLWIVALGIVPAYFVLFQKIATPTRKALAKCSALTFATLIVLAGINFHNLLWIDKHSKQIGALAMPYSYIINSLRLFGDEWEKNKREIPLPDAKITNDKKSAVVLVIGESARAQNFSLYGYERRTNPLLSKVAGGHLRYFNAKSSTTYTSGSVKNMLSHKDSGDLYEILPNYLARNGVSVAWRSANWGEPPLHIKNILGYTELSQKYANLNDGYESALVANLSNEIKAADSPKVLIVIHTSTSHGPTYYKKYPPEFEAFTPVCKSVEGCAQSEIINAYDNTILYTDFLLHSIIEQLQKLDGYESTMIFVSDHGESLGENGVYMHGVPMAFAPKEQYEIPFIVWSSRPNGFKDLAKASHFHIFHSVLGFLGVESEVLDENLNIFNAQK